MVLGWSGAAVGWSGSISQLHRRLYRSVRTAAQMQAAAAVHAACLPFPSNLPQTHCTVSFFPDLQSALCRHAGAKRDHHPRLALKHNTLHLTPCLLAWQSLHLVVLESVIASFFRPDGFILQRQALIHSCAYSNPPC